MASYIQQLENESLLLMYLAGELPGDDQAEVEQLLLTDGGLRAELDRLSAAQEATRSLLEDLDLHQRPPMPENAAIRQMSRLMTQWTVDRLARPKLIEPEKRSRWRWAVYPSYAVAAAALLLIGFYAYWGHAPENPQLSSRNEGEAPGATNNIDNLSDAQRIALLDMWQKPADAPVSADRPATAPSQRNPADPGSLAGLDDMDNGIRQLAESGTIDGIFAWRDAGDQRVAQ